MDENEGRNGKAVMAVSMIGILLGSMMLVGLVRAGSVSFPIPIPNPTGITLNAIAYNGRLGGGDSLIFQVDVTACSRYAVDSVVSATVVAYSDDPATGTAVRYARVGFHHVIVPAYGCVIETKTARVHHASMAMTDTMAYISATSTAKRDGIVSTAADYAWVDLTSFAAQVLA